MMLSDIFISQFLVQPNNFHQYFVDLLLMFLVCLFQVTHQQTGEVMVLKELIRFDEETHKMFLKEVSPFLQGTI